VTTLEGANPLQRPDWRWQRVLELCSGVYPKRCSWRDDDFIRGTRQFILKRSHHLTENEAKRLYSNHLPLTAAWFIRAAANSGMSHIIYKIEARLLARQTNEEIADAVGTQPDVIEWYHALWFDVRPRLQHRDWVQDIVLAPAVMRQYGEGSWAGVSWGLAAPFYDATLKLFAYYGGPDAIDLLLTGGFDITKCPRSPEEVKSWLVDTWKQSMAQRSAAAMMTTHIDKHTAIHLFTLHANLLASAQAVEGAERSARDAGLIEATTKLMTSMPLACGTIGEAVERKAKAPVVNGHFEPRTDELLAMHAGKPVTMPGPVDRSRRSSPE